MPTKKAMCFLSSAFSACNNFLHIFDDTEGSLGIFVGSTISCSFIKCIFLLHIMEYSQRLLPSYVYALVRERPDLHTESVARDFPC